MQGTVDLSLMNEDVMHGKFLIFRVDRSAFGIEISYVKEIIGVQDITHVPMTHDYVKGIINLRGLIVPVVDMRTKFGIGEVEYCERTCIIVLTFDNMILGIITDEVVEVLDIADDMILPDRKSVV